MGGTASKPSVSNSKENAQLNNKPAPKETPKPVPFIIENVSLPADKSPKRRRRFSKKLPAIRDSTPPRDVDDVNTTTEAAQVSGPDVGQQHNAQPSKSSREPGKIETLVREGVTNISKTFRDWTMISSRGSRSAAPVILTDRKRPSSPTISPQRLPNQFNFHHASYLAQSKQEKQSSVDFSAPRHLNSPTKQQPCSADYASAAKQCEGTRKPIYSSSQHMRNRQPSPDNIPAPRNKYGRKKDRSPYYNKTSNTSRQNSPSYLYSLELKQGSSEHCPEVSPMYITCASRAQSPEYMAATYRASNVVIVKPSHDKMDTVDKNSSSEWAKPVGDSASSRCLDTYSQSVIQEIVPIYMPGIQQDVMVQRVEVKQDLDYAVIKPKTIRVNGIEYVRKKSNHPLLKQLLTIDNDQAKVSTSLTEKPERDQTSKSRRAGKEEEDAHITNENHSKSYEENELRITLEKAQRKTVDKEIEKREIIKSKTNGKEVENKEGSEPVNEEKKSDGSETKCNAAIETTKSDKIRKGVETKAPHENERKITEKRSLKRDETSTKVIDKKDKSKSDSNSEVVREKKNINKHEHKPNSRESKDGTRKDTNKREKNAKDVDKKEPTRHEHDIRTIEMKPLSKADRELIKQCRIQHMPIAVSSTGRLFLPSAKFSATPMASMCDPGMKVSACASEKSYCRASRTERLSPNRLRRLSPRRTDQSAKQRGTKKPSAEHQKTSAPKEGKESSENTNTGNNLATYYNSPNRSPNRSPRSTSPAKNHKTNDRQTSPRANKSRENPVLVSSRDPRMAKEQIPALWQGDENPNRTVDTRSNSSPNQTCKRVTEGEKPPKKHEQRVLEKSASTGSSNSSSKGVAKRASQTSIDVWYSKSVRSKNKIFETIIERTTSVQQTSPRPGEQRRASRRSSPLSQESDTPFSKAIKLKYRAISAKRLSRPDICDKQETKLPVVVPKVFTPWDSCMMFKPKHNRAASPRRKKSRSPDRSQPQHTSSRRPTPIPDSDCVWNKALDAHGGNAGTSRPKQCPKSPPTWEETPDNGDRFRPPAPPKFPRESCQSMRNHHRDVRTRQVTDCSCDLDACNCIEVKQSSRYSRSRNDDSSPVSSRYSKLNQEKVQDFEKKFKNTHVYRSVTGVVCKQPDGNVTYKDNHVRTVPAPQNKGHADPATTKVRASGGAADSGTKRQKRCPSCGKCSNASGKRGGAGGHDRGRCAECGGPLDKSSTDSGDEEAGRRLVEVRGRGRCSNCGEQHDMGGCTLQCCVHCGGECCGGGRGRGKGDQHGSGQGSSSGLSATSGQVPPYRKVLKMFETKSKQHASSPRFPPPLSRRKSGIREVTRPVSHFDRHKVPGPRASTGDEEAERRTRRAEAPLHPRDVIIERRRPAHHARCDADADDVDDEERQQANDPHFNRSELELFKNARLQWMARDQQKRQRHHQARGGNHLQAQQARSHQMPAPTSKGTFRRGPPPASKTQDSANGK